MTENPSVRTSSDNAWRETWGSREFVERWATKGGWQAPIREAQVAMVLGMIPHPIEAPIRVLDIGAGYGALAAAVLKERPGAIAVCLDASEAMLKLGEERNPDLRIHMRFVQGSLESANWLKAVDGNFDAVILSRAAPFHREPEAALYLQGSLFVGPPRRLLHQRRQRARRN